MSMTQPFNPALFVPKPESQRAADEEAAPAPAAEEPQANILYKVGESLDSLFTPKIPARKSPEAALARAGPKPSTKPESGGCLPPEGEDALETMSREWDAMLAKAGSFFQPPPPPEPEPEPEPGSLLDRIGKFFAGLGASRCLQCAPPAPAPAAAGRQQSPAPPPAAAAKKPAPELEAWHPGRWGEHLEKGLHAMQQAASPGNLEKGLHAMQQAASPGKRREGAGAPAGGLSVARLLEEHAEAVAALRAQLQHEPLFQAGRHDALWLLRFCLSHHGDVSRAAAAARFTLRWRHEQKLVERGPVPCLRTAPHTPRVIM